MDIQSQKIEGEKLKYKAAYWLVKLLRGVSWLYVLFWVGLLGTLLYQIFIKKYDVVPGDVVLTFALFMPVVGTFLARSNKKVVHYLWSLTHLAYIIVLWLIYHEGYAGSSGEILLFFTKVTLIGLVANQVIYKTTRFYSDIHNANKSKIIPAIAQFAKRRVVAIAVVIVLLCIGTAALIMVKKNPKIVTALQEAVVPKNVIKVVASFDCDKASTRAERLICAPDNKSLREADFRMAALYKKIRGGTKNHTSTWIEESQKNWLQSREKCQYWWCLEKMYEERIDQIEKDIVVNSIPKDRLPWRVVLPNGQDCQFVLEEYVLGRDSDNDQIVSMQERLIYRRGGADQVLWEEQNVYHNNEAVGNRSRVLTGISVIAYNNKQIVVKLDEVDSTFKSDEISVRKPVEDNSEIDPDEEGPAVSLDDEESESSGNGRNIKSIVHRYYSLVRNGSLVYQGSKEMLLDDEYTQGNNATIKLALMSNDPVLSVEDYYWRDAAHSFDPLNLRRTYRFRFDGQAWDEILPEPQTWLGKSDAVKRYSNLYADISKNIEFHNPEGVCRESGVDWALASAGLYMWMDVIDEAYERGVAYNDAAVIVPMLLESKTHPVMTNSQKELFRALGYIRTKIEESENWKGRMINLYNAEKASDNLYELGSKMANEFPAIKIDCAAEFSTKYGFDFDDWLYTFWVRRQLDGTYDIAARVIDYAAESVGAEGE